MVSLIFFFTGLIIGLILGVLSTLLFFRNKKTPSPEVTKESDKNNICETIDPRIRETRELIDIVKKRQNLECYCNPKILKGIKLLSKEPDWERQIDDETLNILSDLNKRRKEYIKSQKKKSANNSVKIDKKHSHVSNSQKVWECTPQEYEQALQNGTIPEDVKIEIVEDPENYHGSWISIDENGEVEEYME